MSEVDEVEEAEPSASEAVSTDEPDSAGSVEPEPEDESGTDSPTVVASSDSEDSGEPKDAEETEDDEEEDHEVPLRNIAIIAGVLLVAYLIVNFIDVWTTAHNDYAEDSSAAIVMGAAQYNGTPSAAFQGRLDTAGGLWESGQVPLIVVTGGSQEDDVTTEAKAGYDYLRSTYNIPDEDLRLEVQGRSTYESLAAAARFLRSEDIDEVIVVTDPYHAARSELVADEVGLEAHSVSTDIDVSASRWISESLWISIGRITTFRRVDALAHGSETENSLAD